MKYRQEQWNYSTIVVGSVNWICIYTHVQYTCSCIPFVMIDAINFWGCEQWATFWCFISTPPPIFSFRLVCWTLNCELCKGPRLSRPLRFASLIPWTKELKRIQNPKCRLYWGLIKFIDWRYSLSCWYCELLSLYLLFDLPHPSPPSK